MRVLKVKINKHGDLLINRVGGWKSVGCVNDVGQSCGDWCPFFNEPESHVFMEHGSYLAYSIKLCGDNWIDTGVVQKVWEELKADERGS